MNTKFKNVLLCSSIICILFVICNKFMSSNINLKDYEKNLDVVEKADSNVELVFTYAENQVETYPTTQGAHKFAELVKERTNGRIEIVVKAAGKLGDDKYIVEQLKFGGVDFARVSISLLSDTIPKLRVLQMPYLYEDSEHELEVLNGEIGQSILESLETTKANIVGLSWYDSGLRHFYSSKKPIKNLEDLNGMKIRVQESEVMTAMIQALGAIPVPMGFKETYSGLQLNDIGAAEDNWPSYESEKHYKVAGYVTETGHIRVPDIQVCSEAVWKQLSEKDRSIIKECAEESAKYEKQLWKQREKSSKERTTRNGVQVIELEEDEKVKFQKALEPLYEQFCGRYMDIIDEIRELRK